ncbi:unnamed protein product [Cochlearia groenlandica]
MLIETLISENETKALPGLVPSIKAKPKSKLKVRLRHYRSHKCKRDQGIVRTSLVHQDDDLACDEDRRQAAEVM